MTYICSMKILKPFKFKQFSVAHNASIHKVGVDGTLLGAWCTVPQSGEILDIGTGCGLIALMCAQRSREARITAVEIDEASWHEASENFAQSPWGYRMQAVHKDFQEIIPLSQYDLIVSNPPFFDSGVTEITTLRQSARHQCALPLEILVSRAAEMLTLDGRFAMVLPADQEEKVMHLAIDASLRCSRLCRVRGNHKAPNKRILIEFGLKDSVAKTDYTSLTLEEEPLIPTEEYRKLCHDFYLKF